MKKPKIWKNLEQVEKWRNIVKRSKNGEKVDNRIEKIKKCMKYAEKVEKILKIYMGVMISGPVVAQAGRRLIF